MKKLKISLVISENKGEEYDPETYADIITEAIMRETTATVNHCSIKTQK